MSELDALDPVPEKLILSGGLEVEFEPLRARQFFKLLRILTRGGLPLFGSLEYLSINPGDDVDTLGGKLLFMALSSVPEAPDETIEFIKVMLKPAGLPSKAIQARNPGERKRAQELWDRFDVELDNPDMEDMISIIEGIINREKEDLAALGKRIMGMMALAEKTGQIPTSPSPSNGSSSEDSAEPSISSRRNTDGPMINVESSLLNDSDKSSQPSESADGLNPGQE